MTALSEALVAAQRQAIAALSKSYLAGHFENPSDLASNLDAMGCTDKVEQAQLVASLDLLHELGAQAPEPTKPAGDRVMASKDSMDYAKKLADRAGTVLPGYQLPQADASKIIDQLKAGTYNPDEWTVPF